MTRQLVPVLSTFSGSTLTMQNWQQAGIQRIAYRLEDLLMKPGLNTLLTLESLHDYVGWQGEIILNARLPIHKNGYRIKNHFDGQVIILDQDVLMQLVLQLKPNQVILPEGMVLSDSSMESIANYHQCTEDLNQSLKPDRLNYIQADLELADYEKLSPYSYWLETDKPMQDGLQGLVYKQGNTVSILDLQWQNHHQVLDENCHCLACQTKLTAAYLHHLLQHTPLLAQRYLVSHNIHYLNQII